MVLKTNDLVERFPRGAPVGTAVEGGFSIVAEQVWQGKDRQEVMGLVWEGVCTACDRTFAQLTPTHPKGLRAECFECLPTLLDNHDPAWGWLRYRGPRGNAVKRRGLVERVVLETLEKLETPVSLKDLVEATVAAMPEPEEGRRDTRAQRTARALDSLSKERNSPIVVSQGFVNYREK